MGYDGMAGNKHWGTQWFQKVKIRHKIILLVMVSRFFPSNSQQIGLIFVSGDLLSSMSKICQNIAGISMTSQFPDYFRQVSVIWPKCGGS